MINTLKSDFYKLKRNKSLWFCLIIICLLLMISILVVRNYQSIYEQQGVINLIPLTAREFAYAAPSSADLSIFLSIFVALYFVTEFTNGTIKNMITTGIPRWQMYLSKFIMLNTICSAVIFASMLFSLLFGLIYFDYGAVFNFVELMRLFGIWLLSTLMFAAYTAIFMFVGVMVRSVGGTIAICLLVFSIFAGAILTVLSNVPAFYPDANLGWVSEISKYFLSVMVANTGDADKLTAADVWRMIYMPIAYIAAFGASGLALFYNKDI